VWRLSLALSKCFRVVLEPVVRVSPILALLTISLFTGVVMLLIFRATSSQETIRRTKDKIKAHLLEILLFNDNLSMVFRAQGSVLAYSLKYLGSAIVPMAVIIVPIALIVTQSNHLFQSKPPAPNATVTVSTALTRWDQELAEAISISVPDGLSVETPALRIPERKQIVWRIRARAYGEFDVVINTPAKSFTKQLTVADSFRWLSHARVRPTLARLILHSAEPPLDRDAPIDSIEVKYAPARMRIGPARVHWLVHFLFKPLLKVEI